MEKITSPADERRKLNDILAYQGHMVLIRSGRYPERDEFALSTLEEAKRLEAERVLNRIAVAYTARATVDILISDAEELIDGATGTGPVSGGLIARARLIHRDTKEAILKDTRRKEMMLSAIVLLETVNRIEEENRLGYGGNYGAAPFFRSVISDGNQESATSERPAHPRASRSLLLPNAEWQFFREIIRLHGECGEPSSGLAGAAAAKLSALYIMLRSRG